MTDDPLGMEQEQAEFAVRCVATWMWKAKERYGRDATAADAEHSSSLRRLLSGKPLLPEPPPLRFSYPDYALAEGGEVEVSEVWTHADPAGGGVVLVVDQCPDWEWVDESAGFMRHKPTGHRYRLTVRAAERPFVRRAGAVGFERGVKRYEGKFLQRVLDGE